VSFPITATGYTNMRDVITLIDAICDVYDTQAFIPHADGTTFCNLAVAAVAGAMGCNDLNNQTADQIVDTLRKSPDWGEVPFEKVQDMANQGSLLIAGLEAKDLNQAHGHVVVIRPGKFCYSGKWGKTPRCLNIGAENFLGRAKRGPLTNQPAGLNEAFVEMPKIWVWKRSL
jgi:hypothetical protein